MGSTAYGSRRLSCLPRLEQVASLLVSLVLALFALGARVAAAEPGPASVPSASLSASAGAPNLQEESDASAPDAAVESPEVQALRRQAQRVRELVAGSLDPQVAPYSLFDIAADDEQLLVVEAKRLHAVLDLADQTPVEAHAGKPGAGTKSAPRSTPKPAGPADASAPDGGPDAASEALDPALWQARVDLDRARLGFYELPRSRRDEILAHHAERQRAAAQSEGQAQLTDAKRRAREADQQRLQALEVAASARTEAERAVGEEYARLLKVSGSQAGFEADLLRARDRLKERGERTLAFERRARAARDTRADASEVDPLYDELRGWLRASRDELAAALSELTSGQSRVPAPGPDPLAALSVRVERSNVGRLRSKLLAAAVGLRASERALREESAAQLSQQVRVLNEDRLALLPLLSGSKSRAITGFGVSGLDQAAAEVRQVTLILRYHFESTRRWLGSLRHPGKNRQKSAAVAAVLVAKLLLALALFFWSRRRIGVSLLRWREAAREQARTRTSVGASPLQNVLDFLIHVQRPVEWLLLVWLVLWLLPSGAETLLEVDIATTVVVWSLCGSLAVSVIDAIAAHGPELADGAAGREASSLRLRSLRLIGRTVVLFGLILSLSDRLVGEGTLYQWVFSTCWFFSIPLVLVIIRWWRKEIFGRIGHVRKKRSFELWVLRNQKGYKSFFAAFVGGAQLFGSGALRIVRGWVGRFDLTRRVLAYLFRRGLDRLGEDRTQALLAPLPEALFRELGPETPSAETVASRGDDKVAVVIERINAPGGGVFAVVGERGAGKTTVLRRVLEARADVVLLDAPFGSLESLRADLARGANAEPDATLEQAAALLNTPERDVGLLIDNAHRLIQPVMGGLAAFDRLVAVARHHCSTCTWVFAMDDVVWRFFERARGARPTFDDVVRIEAWREEEIAGLVQMRSRQAGVEASFRLLFDQLPADADDVDRVEAADQTAASFSRLLWDYAGGNPGVALHMWRRSLGVDPGGVTCVRVFQAPDTNDLEQLPDSAVFVLRAVIQLEQASPRDIAAATLLPESQVEDALRYGLGRGYFEVVAGRYGVTWAWFRAITRFLQRRHLLARSR